jgi:hypothetical protein
MWTEVHRLDRPPSTLITALFLLDQSEEERRTLQFIGHHTAMIREEPQSSSKQNPKSLQAVYKGHASRGH